jgi:hypothetical protein
VIDGYMVNKVVLADAKRGMRTTFSEEELRARLKSVLIQQPAGFIAQVKSVLAEHSVLYDLIRKSTALRHLGASLRLTDPPQVLSSGEVYHSIATYPWLSKAWEQHLENLRQLNFAAKAAGTTMLVVIIPDLVQVYDFMRPKGDTLLYEYPNKRLSEFFEKENIAFVDLLPEFRRYARFAKRPQLDVWEDLYWPHDGHPNVKGNWLTGLLISRYVLEHPFPGLQDKDKRLSDVVQRLSVLPSRPKEVKTISVVTPQ